MLLATAASLLVGLALRWTMLDRVSLWYDEGFTWWVAIQSPGRIIDIIRADTWPPLYYLLMHYWIALFGDGTSAMRAQPAIASCVALVLAVLLSRHVFAEPLPRVASAALLGFSATQINYAHDVRCYATATVVLLAGMLAIVKRLEGGGRWWLVLYIVSGTALVYLHNVMWFYLACLNMAWLLWPGESTLRRRALDMLLANAAIAVLFAPWLPSLLAQLRTVNGSFWIGDPSTYELSKVLSSTSGVHTDALRAGLGEIGIKDSADRLVRWPAFLLVLSTLLAAVLFTKRELRRRVLALLCIALGPIVLAFCYSQLGRSIFIDRVFVPSSVFLAIALAAPAVTALRRRAVAALLVALVLLTAASALLALRHAHEEPWRQAMSHLQAMARPGDRVLFFAAEGELMYLYYARQFDWPALQTGGVPRDYLSAEPPRVQAAARSDDDLRPIQALLADPATSRVLLVDSHAGGLDPQGLVHQLFHEQWSAHKAYEAKPIAIWVCER